MARSKLVSFSNLPQGRDIWLVAVAQLRVWIAPPDQAPSRPWLILVVNGKNGAVRATNLLAAHPTPQELCQVLFQAMREPARGSGKPARPRGLVLAPSFDMPAVLSLLQVAGLQLDVFQDEMPPVFDEMIAELEEQMRGGPEHPGYLSVEGVTPGLVGGMFQAAAAFYRAAPWVRLNNSQVIAVRHPAESDYRYALVMGNGGVEYGVMMFRRWEDVKRQFLGEDAPMQNIPQDGLQSVFFDTMDRLPFADLEAIEKFGWEIAAPDAYPLGWAVDLKSAPRRPSPSDLEWYEAALQVIPIVVRDYLRPAGPTATHKPFSAIEYAPFETTIEVPTHAGQLAVSVKYPAGQLPLAEKPAQAAEWLSADEEQDAEPIFDRRAMEGTMASLTGQYDMQADRGAGDLAAAQELMYRAWQEHNPATRIALAHDALVRSADCADAYVLLAEEQADTVAHALEYYQQGVAAGERALGKEYFRDYVGHFWGLLETRPYMRARHGVANMLWRLERQADALAEYRAMLVLNPGDNQGVRYLVLILLMEQEQYDEVDALLKQYRDEWSAVWMYTRALLAFRRYGTKATAGRALAKALEQNPHVPPYLIGKKRIPNRKPNYIGMGDEKEAIWYASEHLNDWRRVPGAVEWLTGALPQKRAAKKVVKRAAKKKQGKTK